MTDMFVSFVLSGILHDLFRRFATHTLVSTHTHTISVFTHKIKHTHTLPQIAS